MYRQGHRAPEKEGREVAGLKDAQEFTRQMTQYQCPCCKGRRWWGGKKRETAMSQVQKPGSSSALIAASWHRLVQMRRVQASRVCRLRARRCGVALP